MTLPRTIALVAVLTLGVVPPASAQGASGFVTAGVNRDTNGDQIFGMRAGAVTDLAGAWISLGGYADLFVSNGYLGGRLAGITQVNVVRRPHARLFGLSGLSLGVIDGLLVGVGLELRKPGERVGFRITLEDHMARASGFDCGLIDIGQAECDALYRGGRSYIVHQTALQFGVTWQ